MMADRIGTTPRHGGVEQRVAHDLIPELDRLIAQSIWPDSASGHSELAAFLWENKVSLLRSLQALAALSQPQLRDAPEGEWVLVPKEPTEEMLLAGTRVCMAHCREGDQMPTIWEMMLAAAPSPDPAIRKTEEE